MRTVRDEKALQRLAYATGARVNVDGRAINSAAAQATPEPPEPPPAPLPPPEPAAPPVPLQDILAATSKQQTMAMTEAIDRMSRTIEGALRSREPLVLQGQSQPVKQPDNKTYALNVTTSPDGVIESASMLCDGRPEWLFVPVRDDDGFPTGVAITRVGDAPYQ